MALTVAIQKRIKFGNAFGVIADVTFDDSYPTGGESLTAAELGLNIVDVLIPEAYEDAHIIKYDYANKKLMLYEIDTGAFAQEDNSQDMSGVVVKIFAVGT